MKTSTALVFLALIAGSLAETSEEEAAQQCMGEVGAASREELDNDEDKRKCFVKCMLVSAEVIDADGTPNSDNIEKMAAEKISDDDTREEAIEVFKHCADKTNGSQETNPCEKGYIMFECLMDSKEVRELMKPSSQ